MAAAKYKQYYQMMVDGNEQLFEDFKVVHDGYVAGSVNQEEYNRRGQPVVDVIRDFDRRLCSAMGRGAFSKYSEQLSGKFWDEVRKTYSQIDRVGVRVK